MSRKYRITVNGKSYDVDVEEMDGTALAAAPTFAPTPTPVSAPASSPATTQTPAPEAAPAPTVAPGTPGTIESPMPGKILKILVAQGAAVSAGQELLVLEAMKMENEIFAPAAGTVSQIICKEGDSVNTGDPLIVIA
jgi:biotin carboxyl carrier protein